MQDFVDFPAEREQLKGEAETRQYSRHLVMGKPLDPFLSINRLGVVEKIICLLNSSTISCNSAELGLRVWDKYSLAASETHRDPVKTPGRSEMKERMVNAHVIGRYIRKVATNVADNNVFI
jgi:hypothetical protein